VDLDHSQLDRSSLTILQRISELEPSLMSHIDLALKDTALLPANTHSAASSSEQIESPDDVSRRQGQTMNSDVPMSGAFDLESPVARGLPEANAVNSSNAVSEDALPSAEVPLRASNMSIESILKWPILSDSAPQMVTAPRGSTHQSCWPTGAKPAIRKQWYASRSQPDTINRLVQSKHSGLMPENLPSQVRNRIPEVVYW